MISTFGAIASVLIAYFAYNIDIRVQKNALREGRISRAVAISQNIVNDDSVTALLRSANEIEINAAERSRNTDVELKEAFIEENREVVDKYGLRANLTILAQYLDQLVNCMSLLYSDDEKQLGDDGTGEELCDRKTVYVLSGKVLSELYMTFRPALFCDKFFEGEDLAPLVAFVYHYYGKYSGEISDDVNSPYIFRNYDAKEISKWRAENKDNPDNYWVVEFATENCDRYSGDDTQHADAAASQ